MRKLPALLISLSLPVAAFAAAPTTIDLPQMGEPADLVMSPTEEAQIAVEVVHELYQADYVIDDYELSDYITSLGWRLAAAGTPTPPHFRFFPLPDPDINAAAFPGGVIVVNAGTILEADSESELAAVMAHEEAHVTQRHIAREINDTKNADLATWAAMLAAIIAGAANPNLVIGALTLGQGINYNRQISYTRANEMEADRIGIRTLANAGFDPNAMAGFFAKLDQKTRLYGSGLPEILQNHPVNTTRIAEANARAAEYPKRRYTDSPDFMFMRARTRVLLAQQPNSAAEFFRAQLENNNKAADIRYGYAFALSQMNRYEQAMQALTPVVEAYPKQVQVQLLHANILGGLGHTKESLDEYQQITKAYPNYAPAILETAQAQIDAGQNEAARQTLLAHLSALSNQVDTSKLLAEAASANGNMSEAQFQTANYYYERGDARGAIEQLDAALRLASLTPDDRARLLAKRREIIGSLPNGQLPSRQGFYKALGQNGGSQP